MTPSPFRLPDENSSRTPGRPDTGRGGPSRSAAPGTTSGIPVQPAVRRVSAEAGQPVQVTPVRAAFGPAVSLVSVDDQGRLWMRVSTALTIMVGGFVLFLVPLVALWWVGAGLMDTNRINIHDQPVEPTSTNTLAPAKQKR